MCLSIILAFILEFIKLQLITKEESEEENEEEKLIISPIQSPPARRASKSLEPISDFQSHSNRLKLKMIELKNIQT